MKAVFGLSSKTYSYLKDKKAKGTKKCVIKRKLIFEDYKKLFRSSSLIEIKLMRYS